MSTPSTVPLWKPRLAAAGMLVGALLASRHLGWGAGVALAVVGISLLVATFLVPVAVATLWQRLERLGHALLQGLTWGLLALVYFTLFLLLRFILRSPSLAKTGSLFTTPDARPVDFTRQF